MPPLANLFKPNTLSTLGIAASVVCAVHCAALPLLAAFAAVDGHWHNPWLEGGLVGLAAVIGYLTLGSGYRRHGRPAPLVLLTAGLAVLVGGHWFVPHEAAAPVSVAGAALLVAAQWLNRTCPAPCCARSEPHSHEPAL